MMSDHLCSMNETLSKQREEIDMLKLGGKVLRREGFWLQTVLKAGSGSGGGLNVTL